MKIFIDGQYGTTGLEIGRRLAAYAGVELLGIAAEERKERQRRLENYQAAEVVVMCLPDGEAEEMAAAAGSLSCRLLDASSAHRCAPDWVYGLPELEPGQEERIAAAARVSNPGCFASASILLLKPLVASAMLAADTPVTIYGFSGYSGGGRQLIERYQHDWQQVAFAAYGWDLQHKHLPEIRQRSGLRRQPLLLPAVLNCRRGMMVSIVLHREQISAAPTAVLDCYRQYYQRSSAVQVLNELPLVEGKYLQLEPWQGCDYCSLAVRTDGEYLVLVAMLDNLGKGAAGAAIENLRLMLQGC